MNITYPSEITNNIEGVGVIPRIAGTNWYILPIRDDEAPLSPKRVGICSGGIKDTFEQTLYEEFLEELHFTQDGQLLLQETNLSTDHAKKHKQHFYSEAAATTDILPKINYQFPQINTNYSLFDSVPQYSIDGDLTYNIVPEIRQNKFRSYQAMQVADMDITEHQLLSDEIQIYDGEMIESEGIYINRPVSLVNPEQDTIKYYRGGVHIGTSTLTEVSQFFENTFNWNMSHIQNPFLEKTQAIFYQHDQCDLVSDYLEKWITTTSL